MPKLAEHALFRCLTLGLKADIDRSALIQHMNQITTKTPKITITRKGANHADRNEDTDYH